MWYLCISSQDPTIILRLKNVSYEKEKQLLSEGLLFYEFG